MALLKEPRGEVKAGCRQRDYQVLGLRHLLETVGGVFWDFQAKARLVNSNQDGVWVSSTRVLTRRYTREGRRMQ